MDRMPLAEKKIYRGRRLKKQPSFKKRRRTGLYVLIGLIVVIIGALIFFDVDLVSRSDDAGEEQVAEAPDTASEEASDEEAAEEEEEEAAPPIPPPDDPTMFLTIPKLGIHGALVVPSEAGLELGAQVVGGYPWLPGSNTYIAGHRIGFPGTGSDHIFYNVPLLSSGDEIFLQDTLGRVYRYRVSKVFAVEPGDVWVMEPVAGKDVVSLQTCTETLDDWWTVGPRLMSSGPDSGRLIAQAERA
jgi:sortase A